MLQYMLLLSYLCEEVSFFVTRCVYTQNECAKSTFLFLKTREHLRSLIKSSLLYAVKRCAQLLSNIAYTFREDLGRRSNTLHHEVRRSLR